MTKITDYSTSLTQESASKLVNSKSKLFLTVVIASGIVAAFNIHSATSSSQSILDSAEVDSNQSESIDYNSSGLQALSSHIKNNETVHISEDTVAVDINSESEANVAQSDSSISVRIDNKSTATFPDSAEPTSQSSLTINGHNVAIPENGRVSETIKDESTKTRLRADVDGEGTSSIRISTETNN